MNKKTLSISFLAFAGLAVGIYFLVANSNYFSNKKISSNVILLSPAKVLKNISLLDHNDKSFTNKNLTGKWSFIFFGYTSCPDICPTTLHVLANSYKKLLLAESKNLPQIIFVSVDPDRDRYKGNPDKLKNYISFFHKDFIAVTGNHNQLKLFTGQLGAAYGIKSAASGKRYSKEDYEVAHTPLIFIVNPQGQFSGFIRPPHTTEIILDLFEHLLKNG